MSNSRESDYVGSAMICPHQSLPGPQKLTGKSPHPTARPISAGRQLNRIPKKSRRCYLSHSVHSAGLSLQHEPVSEQQALASSLQQVPVSEQHTAVPSHRQVQAAQALSQVHPQSAQSAHLVHPARHALPLFRSSSHAVSRLAPTARVRIHNTDDKVHGKCFMVVAFPYQTQNETHHMM